MIDAKFARVAMALSIMGSLLAYTIEFAFDQKWSYYHRGHAGFIILYVCIVILCFIGLYGLYAEQSMVVCAFELCFLVLVIIDFIYLGAKYAIVIGSIALIIGFFYIAETMGSGGK